MHSPEALRDGLVELAEPLTPVKGYEVAVMRRAARLRTRRRLVGAVAAAACLAVVVAMVRLVGFGATPQLVATPPDGPFLGWAAAGDVDANLVREATDVWNRAGSAQPHTDVRALVATHDQLLHYVVVLQGYDKQHTARLAFFTSDASAADALQLRADRPAPDPAETQVISLVSPRLTGPAAKVSSDPWGTYAIAVAMPGVTILQMSSTAIDENLAQESGSATGRFIVRQFQLASTATTVTITGFIKSTKILSKPKKVFAVSADGGADGDARAVRGEVVSRTDQQIVVALSAGRSVRPGQLAVVAAGLVGRVASVDQARGQATIDLVTSPEFVGQAYTNISNVPGSVRGTGARLVMDHIPPGDKMDVYRGNRVVVPDPSQQDGAVGAVTIGRASVDKAAGADTVDLTPSVDLAHLHDVSIMTPFGQS